MIKVNIKVIHKSQNIKVKAALKFSVALRKLQYRRVALHSQFSYKAIIRFTLANVRLELMPVKLARITAKALTCGAIVGAVYLVTNNKSN